MWFTLSYVLVKWVLVLQTLADTGSPTKVVRVGPEVGRIGRGLMGSTGGVNGVYRGSWEDQESSLGLQVG